MNSLGLKKNPKHGMIGFWFIKILSIKYVTKTYLVLIWFPFGKLKLANIANQKSLELKKVFVWGLEGNIKIMQVRVECLKKI